MSRGERWEFARCLKIAGVQIIVKVVKELHESVRITFSMTTGICRIRARSRRQERWIFDEYFVGLIAASNPKRVRFFCVPSQRTFGPINFKMKFAFPAGAHLRNGKD